MSNVPENNASPVRADHPAGRRYVAHDLEWDIDRDVLRGRKLDFSCRFLPDGLSLLDRLTFLREEERRLLSQLQGRSYAATLCLVERCIGATALRRAEGDLAGCEPAAEFLARFAREERKHQELFRRLEQLMSDAMPAGYVMATDPDEAAAAVLGRSAWSRLALACQVELLARAHYEQTFEPREDLCPLYKDVFQFRWRDECRHAVLDELEWAAEHAKLSAIGREHAVSDFIALLTTVGDVLQAQSQADTRYYLRIAGRRFTPLEARHLASTMLAAYRWQFLVSGMQHVHFRRLLTRMTTPAQCTRILAALQPVLRA